MRIAPLLSVFLFIGGTPSSSRADGGALSPALGRAAPATVAPSAAAVAPATSPPHAPESSVTRFEVKLRGDHVELSWSPPSEGALVRVVRQLRTTGPSASAPVSHLVYEGPATSVTHPVAELSVDTSAVDPESTAYEYTAFGCAAAGSCEQVPRRAIVYPQLLAALRRGGYVLHFRHATAEVCADVEPLGKAATTTQPGWWKSCERDCPKATARQLNDQGIAEAKQLGAELRRLRVPIARIVTSEFCRTRETARLMGLRAHGKLVPIETAKALTSFVYDEENRCADTYKLLALAPNRGTNTVLVGHKGAICPMVGSLNSGGVAIFRPLGPSGARSIAVLDTTDWARY